MVLMLQSISTIQCIHFRDTLDTHSWDNTLPDLFLPPVLKTVVVNSVLAVCVPKECVVGDRTLVKWTVHTPHMIHGS